MESLHKGRRFGSIAFVLLLAISIYLMAPTQREMHFTDNPILKGQDEKVATEYNQPETVTGQLWPQKALGTLLDQYDYGRVLIGNSERLNL